MRAYRLAYDGTDYRGFQRQPHGETVENELFEALAAHGVTPTPETPPDGYSAAGRTDKGVSAVQQTVAFEAPDWLSPRALNGHLPGGVRAWAHADAPDGFDAQYDARRRHYEYHLHAPEADDERAREVCDRLSGEQDVHNLTPDETGTERDLSVDCERDGAYLVCTVSAGGFPRQFVRRAVGLIAAVASSDRPVAFADRVLSAETVDGPEGVGALAPEPLLLRRVAYDLTFEVDETAAASAWTVFEKRRVSRETSARVAERLRSGASR
ncbi:tRNA pseudouridine(38-40) synthase TruA [Halorarius halobius]|uniref:tRNA pseudouridine(38-40) synthase TruA n=1 Tax=Halorarius halobius TaxID=2962671 RepID=UPI0020CCF0D6|nr:tRNA pseudouridine(38-40) synthase TruA [Halorarius halobius]